ncbi:MAG: dethiobiotin synthase [Victivallales bacterium]
MAESFFITGTGTGVGKTIVTAGLAGLFLSRGRNVSVMKPVQTGTCESVPDLETIKAIVPGITPIPKRLANPYSLSLPASPLLAAKSENRRINPNTILKAFKEASSRPDLDVLLVEGAGGLLVPLTDKFLMIDLISEMDIPAILVSTAGLGTVNHTLLSIEAMKKRNLKIAGIVINRMPRNPGVVEKDNVRTIERLGGVPVMAAIREFDFLGMNTGSVNCGKNKIADFANQMLIEFQRFQNLD